MEVCKRKEKEGERGRERERERADQSHFGSSREWFEPPARALRVKLELDILGGATGPRSRVERAEQYEFRVIFVQTLRLLPAGSEAGPVQVRSCRASVR